MGLWIPVIATGVVLFLASCGESDEGTASKAADSPASAGSTSPQGSTSPTDSAPSTDSAAQREPGSVESNAGSGAEVKWVKIDKSRPTVSVPGGPPPKQLVIRDLQEGTGPPAEYGDELTFMYAGRFFTTGERFSSSWDWGNPRTIKLGGGGEDAGWETGLDGMRVGGRRELIVPGGFQGRSGFPPGSGPEDTIVYVIDLFAID